MFERKKQLTLYYLVPVWLIYTRTNLYAWKFKYVCPCIWYQAKRLKLMIIISKYPFLSKNVWQTPCQKWWYVLTNSDGWQRKNVLITFTKFLKYSAYLIHLLQHFSQTLSLCYLLKSILSGFFLGSIQISQKESYSAFTY